MSPHWTHQWGARVEVVPQGMMGTIMGFVEECNLMRLARMSLSDPGDSSGALNASLECNSLSDHNTLIRRRCGRSINVELEQSVRLQRAERVQARSHVLLNKDTAINKLCVSTQTLFISVTVL